MALSEPVPPAAQTLQQASGGAGRAGSICGKRTQYRNDERDDIAIREAKAGSDDSAFRSLDTQGVVY